MRLPFIPLVMSLLGSSVLLVQGQAPPSYAITDLGAAGSGTPTVALAVNALGHATGLAGGRAFLYTPGRGMVTFSPYDGGPANSLDHCSGVSINLLDQIIVRCRAPFLTPVTHLEMTAAFVYSPDGTFTQVGANAIAINDSGQILYSNANPNGSGDPGGSSITSPGIAPPKSLTLPGYTVVGVAMNNLGQVTGRLLPPNQGVPSPFFYDPQTGVSKLALSAGVNPLISTAGTAINDAGVIAGNGFLYDSRTGITTVGPNGDATGINNRGDVVGNDANSQPFLFNSTIGMVNLNSLIPANSGWTLVPSLFYSAAQDINDNGQIVGAGMFQGEIHAFLLTPVNACAAQVSPTSLSLSAAGGPGSLALTIPQGCAWTATSDSSWLAVTPPSGASNGMIAYVAAPNPSQTMRVAVITVGTAAILVTQAPAAACNFSVAPLGLSFGSPGGQGVVTVTTDASCSSGATTNADWIYLSNVPPTGSGNITITVGPNPGPARSGVVTIGAQTVVIVQGSANQTAATRFVPITPCRIADTRVDSGKSGPFGPPYLTPSVGRDFPVPASACGIPGTARAYALNITAVPYGALSYLSVWPTGQPFPQVSTLNANDGSVVANAAIVAAGAGGAVSVLASNLTDVIIDVNGYFVSADAPQALAFYSLTPCRIADTRAGQGTAGPFGPPSLHGGNATRLFPLRASNCGIPASAQAYSLNFTAAPTGKLSYLTVGPSGQPQPLVSTLNSWNGELVANAAIVPAGADGSINVYSAISPDATSDLIIDINGYFAPPGAPGALSFYPLPSCRVADTRTASGKTDGLGSPSLPVGGNTRDFPLATPNNGCGLSTAAQAYSLNMTLVPSGTTVDYLTAWATGGARPLVSTLNSFDGRVVANAAIVPAGTNGAISVFTLIERLPASDLAITDLLIDVNGYFAP